VTKADLVATWRARIAYAKEKRRIFYEGQGDDNETGLRLGAPGANFAIEVFRGNTRPRWWSTQDAWIHVGKLKAAVRAAIPSLLYRDPEYKIFPAAKDMEGGQDVAYQRARAKALWLNHWWKEGAASTHCRIGIQNAFFSIGCIKAGYKAHFQDDETRGVFEKDDYGNYVLDANGDPQLERGEYLYDEDGEILRAEDGFPQLNQGTVQKEEWFVEVIDCRMMLFDVDSGPDFFQHRYCIEEWVRPLKEVQDDPRFSPAKRKRLKGTENRNGIATSGKGYSSSNGDGGINAAVEEDEQMLRGYDIYDFQEDRYMVLPECGLNDENDEFLLDGEMPPGMEHGPFRFLKYTEDVGTEWYPIPDATDMALVNQEYDLTRSQMFIHREHTKTRYTILENTFAGDGINAEDEMEKLAHGPDATFVKVASHNGIQPLQKASLDNSFMQAVPNIAADFNEVGGMPGEMRGVADSDTATQASILATGAEIRNNDRRDNQVAQWLQQIGRVLLMSGQANAELDSLVIEKVVDATGVTPFRAVKLTPEELLGEFEVTIEVGSTQAKNDPRTLQSLATFLANLGQNPMLGLIPGLNRRILDGMGMDPNLADEIFDASKAYLQSQQAPAQGSPMGPPTQSGQQLPDMLMGQGNAAGAAPTGAPVN
tara:strand:- start:6394 stop:8349 length:1956 start_codon:yes stop_codon:yes gene_type:complete